MRMITTACNAATMPVIGPYLEAFPGVKAAKSVEELVENVDAVWLGDASGYGDDHLALHRFVGEAEGAHGEP